MDFQDSLNWDLVLRQDYFVTPTPSDPKNYSPIPSITVLVDSYTLAIGARSDKALNHWYLAAYVNQRLLFVPSSTSDFIALVQTKEDFKIRLNQLNLIQFPNFGISPYVLEIKIPYWHEHMFLEVWKYSGTDNAKPVQELIAEVRSDLNRIESKIDSQSTP